VGTTRLADSLRTAFAAQGGHGLVAILRLLGHGPVENGLEDCRSARVDLAQGACGLVDDRVQHLDRVASLEGRRPRRHLVEEHAQAEDVRPVVHHRRPRRLLGARVAHRAVGHSDLGHRVVEAGRRRLPVFTGKGLHLGQPEVQHLGLALGGDDDVRRLEVAVHDAVGVGHR
jgi:hypothetical protein